MSCVAMLLDLNYREALKLLHPDKDISYLDIHGFRCTNMEDDVHRLLGNLGFKSHTGRYKKFCSYKRWVKKNAIMIIRWDCEPNTCHCILYDADGKQFIDPDGGYIIGEYTEKCFQRQLEVPIIIDSIPDLRLA